LKQARGKSVVYLETSEEVLITPIKNKITQIKTNKNGYLWNLSKSV